MCERVAIIQVFKNKHERERDNNGAARRLKQTFPVTSRLVLLSCLTPSKLWSNSRKHFTLHFNFGTRSPGTSLFIIFVQVYKNPSRRLPTQGLGSTNTHFQSHHKVAISGPVSPRGAGWLSPHEEDITTKLLFDVLADYCLRCGQEVTRIFLN